MSDNPLSPEEQQEMEQLAALVASSLAKGEKPKDIIQQLVNNGWEQSAADEFVGQIALQRASALDHVRTSRAAAHSDEGGSGMGWLVWIGALLFINFLSWLFNWPFWVY